MQKIINIQGVSYRYSQASKPILDGLSFDIKTGEIISLLGANGCGKSTLLKLLVGDLTPTSGIIQKEKNIKVAYISQNIHQSLFMDLTVQENLKLMGLAFSRQEEAEKYLKSFHKKLFSHYDQPVTLLSGGEKQALILAITLYHNPDLLLLDEHTSAMDPEAEKTLMTLTHQKIKEKNITTFMCTHKLSVAETYSSRIIGLNNGKLILDSKDFTQGLLKEHLDKIYG